MASSLFPGGQPKSVSGGPPLLSVPCDITQGQRAEVVQSSPSLRLLGPLLPGIAGQSARGVEEEGPGRLRGHSWRRLNWGRRTEDSDMAGVPWALMGGEEAPFSALPGLLLGVRGGLGTGRFQLH